MIYTETNGWTTWDVFGYVYSLFVHFFHRNVHFISPALVALKSHKSPSSWNCLFSWNWNRRHGKKTWRNFTALKKESHSYSQVKNWELNKQAHRASGCFKNLCNGLCFISCSVWHCDCMVHLNSALETSYKHHFFCLRLVQTLHLLVDGLKAFTVRLQFTDESVICKITCLQFWCEIHPSIWLNSVSLFRLCQFRNWNKI